jgi:hypothetical protein
MLPEIIFSFRKIIGKKRAKDFEVNHENLDAAA